MRYVTRYHPLLVGLHWLVAVLLILNLVGGYRVVRVMMNTDPQKIGVLKIHMAVGVTILALMVLRFFVRVFTARPPPASTGSPALDKAVPLGHLALYVLVILMAGTGYATALMAGLPDIVFAGNGQPLPPDFNVYPPRVAHRYIGFILVVSISLHFLAALYHQFVRRDSLLRRMGFGRRDL